MTKVLAAIGAFVVLIPVILGASILGLMWRAWWLYPAWAWFVVPLGMRAISFWHFTALLMLVQTMTHQASTKEDPRKESWALWVGALISPVIAWALLWWVHRA